MIIISKSKGIPKLKVKKISCFLNATLETTLKRKERKPGLGRRVSQSGALQAQGPEFDAQRRCKKKLGRQRPAHPWGSLAS